MRTESVTGELIEDFIDEATVSAEVLELRGRDFFSNREAHTEVSVKVSIHYRSDIDGTWRVVFGTRVFELVGEPIDLKGRRRTLELMCKELAS